MNKKLLALGLAVAGLSLLGTQFALATDAVSLASWDATDTSELAAWIGQLWTDWYLAIILGLGLSIGFVVLRKVVGMVKGAAR